MKKNNKKGFTIVELVIVIAVIAILAAVLIPTFSSVIKKAKVNNDIQLVRNLNTALATDNKKHETMQDALDAAAEFGYDVAKINASATDNEILWDGVNDVFCYLKDGAIEYIPKSVSGTASLNANDYRLWKISDTVDETYSTYYTGSATTINTSKGFDAGTTTGITAINYTNNGAQQDVVVIRTNGGMLTIDAPNDTVYHYDAVDKVVIAHVGSHSYHENGIVAVSMEVKDGHVVIDNSGYVKELVIPESLASDAVSIDIVTGAIVNTAIIDDASATIAVASGAQLGQVVGTTTNISGDGATEAKENAVVKTEVGTKDALFAAIADSAVKYILLTANIDAKTRVTIDRDLIIDGSVNKYSISASEENIENGRTVNAIGGNRTITFKNLKIVGPTSGGFTRGLNIGDNNMTITIDNCDIACSDYAINVFQPSDNLKLTVTDSDISGWAAINMWGFKHEISFTNSTLTGTNDKSVSSWNNFATICFEADTTQLTDNYSGYNTVTLNGCTVNAIETNSNYQRIVSFNGGVVGATGSTFITNNCTFNSTNKHAFSNGGDGNSWINDGEELLATVSVDFSNVDVGADGYTATGTVKFTVNGKTITYNLSSATTSMWTSSQTGTTGMDYIFEYNAGILTYHLDLDICTGYYESGYAVYVDGAFSE